MDIIDEYAVKKCIYKDVSYDFVLQAKEFNFVNYQHDFVVFFTDWTDARMTSLWVSERIHPESVEEQE